VNITLESVRKVLREAFGFESFIAGFIKSVTPDEKCQTAGITKDGHLVYNPAFVNGYIYSQEDIFTLVFHEILHPMFGHFIYRCGPLENIAADAVINAIVTRLYARESNDGYLFTKYYSDTGIQGLLRPKSRMYESRFEKLYNTLFNRNCVFHHSLSTGEVIQTLKILVDIDQASSVVLIGSHGNGDDTGINGAASDLDFPQETAAKIAEDIGKSLADMTRSNTAGKDPFLKNLLMEALKTHLSMKKALLQKFVTDRKLDKFKSVHQDRRISTSPIPIHPSKRDMILLAAGIYPLRYRNLTRHTRPKNKGLAVYLDVSGSVNDHLPQILGILSKLKSEITTIYQFSNAVVETSFKSLLKGHISTTYGTDFDCIAKSIIEKTYDRAVIITDGVASMKANLKEELKSRKVKTLTVLFGSYTDRSIVFGEFGDVMELDEVCV